MRYLLDTHAFLWLITADPKLGRSAEQIITGGGNTIFLSMATLWEIAIKVNLGKPTLNAPFASYLPREIAVNNLVILHIRFDHIAIVATLPHHHRDPFDRLLVAQSLTESMPILSVDPALDAYGITRIW
jgi:PIN domain nuclease of toxin-antitoxin system